MKEIIFERLTANESNVVNGGGEVPGLLCVPDPDMTCPPGSPDEFGC